MKPTQSPCLEGVQYVQAAQTDYPARPQPKNRPQAYPLGYVEDLFEVRTQLGVCFSSLIRRRPCWRTSPSS